MRNDENYEIFNKELVRRIRSDRIRRRRQHQRVIGPASTPLIDNDEEDYYDQKKLLKLRGNQKDEEDVSMKCLSSSSLVRGRSEDESLGRIRRSSSNLLMRESSTIDVRSLWNQKLWIKGDENSESHDDGTILNLSKSNLSSSSSSIYSSDRRDNRRDQSHIQRKNLSNDKSSIETDSDESRRTLLIGFLMLICSFLIWTVLIFVILSNFQTFNLLPTSFIDKHPKSIKSYHHQKETFQDQINKISYNRVRTSRTLDQNGLNYYLYFFSLQIFFYLGFVIINWGGLKIFKHS
ncbi:expressed protein [Phakopsora pachyrhizi]|uniref:Expressed protein n=1 Tax=Phakopsora pachyrhizi TaxID=170000 RepID=A0AAV0AZW8_PHAPC|nr:expressed protein [Phakopsora pachyrhizi]